MITVAAAAMRAATILQVKLAEYKQLFLYLFILPIVEPDVRALRAQ